MLATCAVNGWPTDGYLGPDHPVQVAILAAVEDLAGEPIAHVAVDGCGAPNMAVSLTGLARAFARLATAEPGTPEHRAAQAMRDHPEVVGGEERDVTKLLRAVPGLVAKDGAEGCFAAATPTGGRRRSRSTTVRCGPPSGAGRRAAGRSASTPRARGPRREAGPRPRRAGREHPPDVLMLSPCAAGP